MFLINNSIWFSFSNLILTTSYVQPILTSYKSSNLILGNGFEENLFIEGLSAVKEKYGEQIKKLFNVDIITQQWIDFINKYIK